MHQQEVGGILLLSYHLRNTRRHGNGGNACGTDEGVDLLLGQEVHELCKQNAAGRTVVDFGRDAVGWLVLSGPEAGPYELVMGELLNERVFYYPEDETGFAELTFPEAYAVAENYVLDVALTDGSLVLAEEKNVAVVDNYAIFKLGDIAVCGKSRLLGLGIAKLQVACIIALLKIISEIFEHGKKIGVTLFKGIYSEINQRAVFSLCSEQNVHLVVVCIINTASEYSPNFFQRFVAFTVTAYEFAVENIVAEGVFTYKNNRLFRVKVF